MTSDPQVVAWLDQEDAHLAQVIRAHRFAVQFVGPGDETDEPPFGYTIGLFGLGHPELVVAGLDSGPTNELLNHAAELVTGGRDLVVGELVPWEGGDPVYVALSPNAGEVVLGANRYYQRPAEVSVPAYQLMWAHPGGLFPWEENYPCPPGCQPLPGTWRA
jgi:hypothetical protein